ncbi:MAG: RluA family pseudouridine synthase [Myxococcales bacterium]|nr:RluA family pseudouridine synthase [Myxococcales bacterium]
MISAEKFRVRVTAEHQGLRLDQFLAATVPDLSRRKARVLLDIGGVYVDRARVKVASRVVKEGQLVEVVLGGAFDRATKKTGTVARSKDAAKLPLHTVLFEDEHICVVYKPAGLLTAPTPESDRGNLSDVLSRERNLRMFVVHRIDLDTSGILVFAKTEDVNRELGETFRKHAIERQYLAVVDGQWPDDLLRIEEDVGGKSAVSHFEVDKRIGERVTVLRVTLETGRTHQIRLHAAGAGLPVLGDKQHGKVSDLAPPRMALHARKLAFAHPSTGEAVSFESQLPEDLSGWLSSLEERLA